MSQGETSTGTTYGISGVQPLRFFRPCPAIAPLNLAGVSTLSLVTCQREEGHDGDHRLLLRWDGAITRMSISDQPSIGEGET